MSDTTIIYYIDYEEPDTGRRGTTVREKADGTKGPAKHESRGEAQKFLDMFKSIKPDTKFKIREELEDVQG